MQTPRNGISPSLRIILQAIDFNYLYERYDVELQIGGSDQWGNLVSGVDLIRRSKEMMLLFMESPLHSLLNHGSKFGKSEGENIWLDANAPHRMRFTAFINTSDDDVMNFIKRLSENLEEIMEIEVNLRKHLTND